MAHRAMNKKEKGSGVLLIKGSWSERKGGEVQVGQETVAKKSCKSEVKENRYAESVRKKDSEKAVVKRKCYQLRRGEGFKIIVAKLLIMKSSLL